MTGVCISEAGYAEHAYADVRRDVLQRTVMTKKSALRIWEPVMMHCPKNWMFHHMLRWDAVFVRLKFHVWIKDRKVSDMQSAVCGRLRESRFFGFLFLCKMHIPVDKEYDLKKAWTTKEKGCRYG